MRAVRILGAMAALLLAGNSQPRDTQALTGPPTPEEVEIFGSSEQADRSYEQQPLAGWEADLRRAVAGGASLDRAADSLAPRYGLAPADMRRLAGLWITAEQRRYTVMREPAARDTLRRNLRTFAAAAPRNPLILQAAAESLDALLDCQEEDFNALMAGSTDRAADAWMIANAAPCLGNFVRAATIAPDRSMPVLIRLLNWGSLGAADALSLYHSLTSPQALARISDHDRPALSAWLYAGEARLLFETGLTARAVALLESLPPDLRSRVLSQDEGEIAARIDNIPVTITVERRDERVKFYLASAYALAGRTSDAEALFASLRQVPAARLALDCALRTDQPQGRESPCARIDYRDSAANTADLMLLDHLLHDPDADPYPLAEAGFSGMGGDSSGAVAELRCRVFADARFEGFCEGARQIRTYAIRREARTYDGSDGPALARQLAALPLPGLAEARGVIAGELARVLATLPPLRDDTRSGRASVAPAPGPFAEHPLPEANRGARGTPVRPPAGTASLPQGFLPVRFERDGTRAAMVSVSQTYDPTGEASQGGYWVHLSEDGGRHWGPPLYTGLSQNFPYLVPSASRLPLLNGDRLDLEVEVAELDTASISYPPVAMRTGRRARNLYLQIPLAALSRDSNNDGITDIAAHALLLDQARTDGGTPFIVGSDNGADCGAPPAERTLLVALLERLFSRGSGAIVEPVDRPGDQPLALNWRSAGAATNRPVFIRGEPRDYRCLRPNRLMVVYGAADIAALGRFHPDFHAVAAPRIVYNRARDRGYVVWSAGWTGGTFRIRLVDGRWQFDEISSWIT